MGFFNRELGPVERFEAALKEKQAARQKLAERLAVTEADLVLPDDQGDLHIPHYVNLFGGTVFLESLNHFEERLRKAFASSAAFRPFSAS